jgi:hypothetical protein
MIGHNHTEYRVAEELQALIGLQATTLVGVGAVGERKSQQPDVKIDVERSE